MARTRLNLDLDALLPGEEFQIGNESVTIRPLSIIQYKFIIGKSKALIKSISEQGVTEENYKDRDSLITIAETVIDKFPDLLEEVSNISAEDLQQLPLEIIIALIEKCLDVNLKAKESLLGNFKSLTGKIHLLGFQTENQQ